jgi:hypothetical protein
MSSVTEYNIHSLPSASKWKTKTLKFRQRTTGRESTVLTWHLPGKWSATLTLPGLGKGSPSTVWNRSCEVQMCETAASRAFRNARVSSLPSRTTLAQQKAVFSQFGSYPQHAQRFPE